MTSAISRPGSFLRSDAVQRLLAFSALLIIIIVFSVLTPYFATTNNAVGILIATAVNGILAIGVTFVIISGGIDLSIGTVMTFSAVMTAVLVTNMHLPLVLGIVGGVLAGALFGLVNGVLISLFRIPPFIATLGTMQVARGLALVLAEVKPIYFNDTPEFNAGAMGSAISLGSIFPGLDIPNIVLVFFGAAILAAFVLGRTILGRYTFAIGSNEEATRLSGVNVRRWKAAVYVVSGLFAGLAGVVIAARLNSAQPAVGMGYELDAIAAAVIGGTSLSGGEGTIVGTVIGAFIISTLTNGLRMYGVQQELQFVVTGSIVILAVYLDIVRRRAQA